MPKYRILAREKNAGAFNEEAFPLLSLVFAYLDIYSFQYFIG